MKWLLAIAATLITVLVVRAQLVDKGNSSAMAFGADYSTILVCTNLATNQVSSAVEVDLNLYHAVHFYCSTNLNGALMAIDHSLDTTNWISGGTNTVSANTGNVWATNFTGKYGYIRVRMIGTNIVGAVNYLGGR